MIPLRDYLLRRRFQPLSELPVRYMIVRINRTRRELVRLARLASRNRDANQVAHALTETLFMLDTALGLLYTMLDTGEENVVDVYIE